MPSIGAWCESRHALEEATDEGRVLIPNLPTDLIDRRVCPLQPALCIFDPQTLNVDDRSQTGRIGKAPLEGPFSEQRALDHFLHRV